MAFIAALVRFRNSLSDPPKHLDRTAQVGRIPGYGRGMAAVFPETGRVFQVKHRGLSVTPAVPKSEVYGPVVQRVT
jgi:hypothetical protein